MKKKLFILLSAIAIVALFELLRSGLYEAINFSQSRLDQNIFKVRSSLGHIQKDAAISTYQKLKNIDDENPIDLSSSKGEFERLESLEEIERKMIDRTIEELQLELKKSITTVAEKSLVEKANHSNLSNQEVKLLILELRKQGALHKLILEKKLAAIEHSS